MASHKIAKKNGTADEIELSVAQALYDLENNVNDLKSELKPLQISSAKEVSLDLTFQKVVNPANTGIRDRNREFVKDSLQLSQSEGVGGVEGERLLKDLEWKRSTRQSIGGYDAMSLFGNQKPLVLFRNYGCVSPSLYHHLSGQ